MTVRFHHLVQKDIWEIIDYYERESGPQLADEFYGEFMVFVSRCQESPERFHFDGCGLRRANFHRFPFHFLYRIRRDDVLILVLRHHTRHPSFGLRRR